MIEMELLEKTAREFISRDLVSDFSKSIARAREAGFFDIESDGELCKVLERFAESDAGFAAAIFSQYAAYELMGKKSGDLVGLPVFQDPTHEELTLVAQQDGAHYRISGECPFVLLGWDAKQFLVPARIAGVSGFSYFLVTGPDSVSAESVLTLGLRGCPVADLRMHSSRAVRVESPGEGAVAFTKMCARMNLVQAALIIGVLRPALKAALDYASERTQGGRAILDWSAHRMLLADLIGRLRISEAALAEALRARNEGRPDAEALSLSVAVHLQETAGDFSSSALRSLGGSGYMKDFSQERYFRDAHALSSLLGSASLKKLRLIEITHAGNA